MKHRLGMLLATTALMAVPAAAQDAAGVLQAADRAIGASGVNSVVYTGTGTMRYVGQSYDARDDWPKSPLTAYTATIDYPSKSSKEDWAVDLSKKDARGGGLPIPKSTDFVNGGTAWNINAQGQTNPQPGAAELRQFMITASPYGFIKAGAGVGQCDARRPLLQPARRDREGRRLHQRQVSLHRRVQQGQPAPAGGHLVPESGARRHADRGALLRLEGRRQRRQVPVSHSRPPGRQSAQRQRPQLVRRAGQRCQGQRARHRGRGTGRGAQRGGPAGPRRVAEARRRRVVHRRRLAQQPRRRAQGLRHRDRRPARRRALECGDRRNPQADPGKADPLSRQHPPPLGSFRWHPGLRRGRRDHRHRRARTGTSIVPRCWLRNRGRSAPTGSPSSRSRRPGPAPSRCRLSTTAPRSATRRG